MDGLTNWDFSKRIWIIIGYVWLWNMFIILYLPILIFLYIDSCNAHKIFSFFGQIKEAVFVVGIIELSKWCNLSINCHWMQSGFSTSHHQNRWIIASNKNSIWLKQWKNLSKYNERNQMANLFKGTNVLAISIFRIPRGFNWCATICPQKAILANYNRTGEATKANSQIAFRKRCVKSFNYQSFLFYLFNLEFCHQMETSRRKWPCRR